MRSVLVSLLVLASACTQELPVRELRAYGAAVEEARKAADEILDDYALVEIPLESEFDTIEADPLLSLTTFSTEDALAAFYRDQNDGDPPDTALRREIFRSIEAYNLVLIDLAEGRPVEELASEYEALGESLLVIAAQAAVVSTGGLGAGLGALQSVLEVIEQERSRANAVALWLEGSPTVLAMIDYLQLEAAPMFEVITEELLVALLSVDPSDVERQQQLEARLVEYQRVFTEYVGLLEHVRLAIDEVDAAVAAGATTGAAVDRLRDRAVDIRETVKTIREAFARMRTAP